MATEILTPEARTETRHSAEYILPRQVQDLLSEFRFAPDRDCLELLWMASRRSLIKKEFRGELSCSGVFLAALDFTGQFSNAVQERISALENPERKQLQWKNIVRWADGITQNDEKLQRLQREYYETWPLPLESDALAENFNEVKPTGTLKEALSDAHNPTLNEGAVQELGVSTLLIAVLRNKRAALRTRLQRLGYTYDDLDKWYEVLSPIPPRIFPTMVSQRLGFSRDVENSAETSLGVNVYAGALASMLRSARGEFCFGLFGPWGIGKTYLAKRLDPLLTSPDKYAQAMLAFGYNVGDHPDDRLRYEVVWYSAWKFRRPPETWIFLYETLARQCLRTSMVRRFSRVLRAGVARNGYWPLVFGLLLLGLFALPTYSRIWLALVAIGIVGLVSTAYALGLVRRVRETVSSLAGRYGMLSRHGQALGMQALIGDDLRALFIGWIPETGVTRLEENETIVSRREHAFSSTPWLAALGLLSAFGTVWLWAMLSAPSIQDTIRNILPPLFCDTVLLQDAYWCAASDKSLYPAVQPIYLATFALWLILCAVVLFTVHLGRETTDRVLLIIDDLDRCSPAETIEIAEALKLLLEDPDIQKRLQVLMLVDENVLEHATAVKFSSLLADREKQKAARYSLDRADVVHEHFEKLFVCHLRLPPLNDEDVNDLAHRYSRMDIASISPIKPARPPSSPTGTIRAPIKADSTDPKAIGETRSRSEPPLGNSSASMSYAFNDRLLWLSSLLRNQARKALTVPNTSSTEGEAADRTLRFDEEEVAMLSRDLAALMKSGERRRSPRAIRIFLFKYQLCRLLLRLSAGENELERGEVSPQATLDALAEACFDKNRHGKAVKPPGRTTLAAVVSQVA